MKADRQINKHVKSTVCQVMINGRENSEVAKGTSEWYGVTIKVAREVREGLTGEVEFEQNCVGVREGASTEKTGKEHSRW